MGKVEFISYDGKYPTLCYGVLVIKVNDKEYSLKGCLHSGGSVTSDSHWNFDVSTGPWEINEFFLPVELQKYCAEIKEVVNANVEYGCCGGCI